MDFSRIFPFYEKVVNNEVGQPVKKREPNPCERLPQNNMKVLITFTELKPCRYFGRLPAPVI